MVNGKKLIALCTSRIYDPQIHNFIKTLNEKLIGNDCMLFIFSTNSDIYWNEEDIPSEAYVFDLLPYEELDGILIMDEKIKSHTVSEKIINRAKVNGVPVVVIDGSYTGVHSLRFNYAGGFEKVVRHLVEEHHVKRPHMMAGFKDNVFSEERIEVFKKVLAENGIAFDDSMLSYGNFWADPTISATKEILKRDILPDAIVCANDIMALNVCDVLAQNNISVPDDIIVTGFDGIDEVYFSNPLITTVSCETSLLTDAAVEMMLDLIQGKKVEDVLIMPRFIENESCGCKRQNFAAQMMARINYSFYRHQDDSRILYEIAARMETSKTVWDMAASIHDFKTFNHLCVVDKNCFVKDKYYFLIPKEEMKKRDLHLINDADYAEAHKEERLPIPKEIFYDDTVNEKENVLSGNYRRFVLERAQKGYPVVFNALDYMNRAFGFNCYYFDDYNISNYSRLATMSGAMSTGIGGFLNLRYQRYLLEKVNSMYNHDPLTGLYNRVGFDTAFKERLKTIENNETPITFIMSDLDGLKYINDNYGHAEGDRAIAAVADALINSCPKDALCVRFGGDEMFSVIIGECDVDGIVNNINQTLINFNNSSNLDYKVSSSSGYVIDKLDKNFDIQLALKHADLEMYKIKSKTHMAK